MEHEPPISQGVIFNQFFHLAKLRGHIRTGDDQVDTQVAEGDHIVDLGWHEFTPIAERVAGELKSILP
jgi:hypothetical protein